MVHARITQYIDSPRPVGNTYVDRLGAAPFAHVATSESQANDVLFRGASPTRRGGFVAGESSRVALQFPSLRLAERQQALQRAHALLL